jgi:tetratricopeptide (TPR) repeat protein
MKKIVLLAIISFVIAHLPANAQQKPAATVLPDISKLQSMSPAEREKYKQQMQKNLSAQAKQISQKYDIKIDETRLPDFELKPPPKDLQRLAMVPIKAPSRMELMTAVQSSRQQLEKAATAPVIAEVKKMVTEQDAAELQRSSVALWYQDKPIEALLTSVGAVQKNGDEVIAWNNLAAMFNMAGLEEKAIPILMHHLANIPDNSLLLNNIGQSFMGLGDMARAEQYFRQCLAIDELNPEANRSMGMIQLFKKQQAEAQKYFEKELEVAHRRSTLAQLKRMGVKIDLNAIRKRRSNVPQRDLFYEISLHKFRIPDLPETPDQSKPWWDAHAGYMNSLAAELLFWTNEGMMTDEDRKADGRKPAGLYSDLCNELLSDLGDTFAPILGLLSESDAAQMEDMITAYWEKRRLAVCETPPQSPGNTETVFKAYEKKCCDLHTPIIADYMQKRNGFVQARYNIADARWKEYINGMISIVQLHPTIANKKMVYNTVASYFSFVITTINTAAVFEDMPAGCDTKMTSQEANDIIETRHDIELDCPQWLNLEFDLQVAKLKADCNKYAIESTKGLLLGYEKNFKTGTSTIAAGVGVEQKFGSLAKLSAKQMVYIAFDNNNQFSDFGLKGTAEGKVGLSTDALVTNGIGKVGTTLAGVEGGYTLGINSGFKGGVKGKGVIAEYLK